MFWGSRNIFGLIQLHECLDILADVRFLAVEAQWALSGDLGFVHAIMESCHRLEMLSLVFVDSCSNNWTSVAFQCRPAAASYARFLETLKKT